MADDPFLSSTPTTVATDPFLAAGAETHSENPASPSTHKSFETPKGARPNPLREIGEVLASPMNLGYALTGGTLQGGGTSDRYGVPTPLTLHPEIAKAALRAFFSPEMLKNPGGWATNFNETFDPFQKGGIKTYGSDPTFGEAQKAAGGELALQWHNPTNLAAGKLLGLGTQLLGRGAQAARAASPVLNDAIKPFEEIGADIARPFQTASAAAKNAAARAVVNVASKVPGSFGAGVRGLVDRYAAAGLPERGGAPYVQAAFAAQAAPEHAAAQATNYIRSQGDGLTLAQKREVQKLSYVDENGNRFVSRDPNVPDPKKGPTLEERAANIRGYLFDLDRRQEALGIRTRSQVKQPSAKNPNPNAKPQVKSGDLYDSGTYWPMRQFGDQPVFQSQDLAEAAKAAGGENGNELQLTNMLSRRGRGKNRFSAAVSKTGHKLERDLPDILNPDVEAELHPEYDPIYQLEKHASDTERAIANEQSRRGLESLPNIDPQTGVQRTTNVPGVGEIPLYARMPLQYQLAPKGGRRLTMVFGQGEAGKNAMERYIGRVADARAAALARQDPEVLRIAEQNGIDPRFLGTRAVTKANVGKVQGRLAEAVKAQRGTSKLASDVAGIASRSTAKVAKALEPLAEPATVRPAVRAYKATGQGFDAASAKAAGLDAKQTERVTQLSDDFKARAAKAESAAAFQKAAKHYYQRAYESVAQNIRDEAEHAPKGYVKESDLSLGSKTGRDMALDESFGKFYKGLEHKSPEVAEVVKKLTNALGTLNRLARASVVLVPTVHGINNLGVHYLAEGGDPATMAEILAGRKQFSDALKQRAYKAAAATDRSQQLFAMDNGAHATTDIGERAQMIGKKAGPLSKVVTPVANAGLHAERVYNAMNKWLFEDVEQGYAFDLFDRFTKQGMSDGEAAMKVRNALGRYDNISPTEQTLMLNKLFYFYPWMKTAISYWTKKGLLDPKWWEAPERAIEVNNEAEGYDDPSRPFTATLGKRSDGEWRRYTVPLPQRVTENIAEAARVPFDAARGDWTSAGEDVKAPLNYILGHMNPALQIGMDLRDLASQGEARIAPFNTFKVQPGETGLQQNLDVASKILGRVISPFGRASSIMQDAIGGIAAYITGGSTYGTKTQAQAASEKAIRANAGTVFHDAITAATNRGDAAEVQRLNAMKEAVIQRAIQNQQNQQSGLSPLPVASPAAAGSDPFLQP